MPEENKLKEFKTKEIAKAFTAIKNGKKTVAEVAESFDVHPTTIRYHMKEGTYARA